jgi:hypothetical protein
MRIRELFRDMVLVAAAVAVGWWCHGTSVHAERGADSGSNLAFQFLPGGDQSSLSVYSPEDRTIYIYPRVGTGNSHISCMYMFHMRQLGGSIDRENCKPGSQLP